MSAIRRTPVRLTVAEFLRWDSGDWSGRRWQLIDGEPVAMAPASPRHAAILIEIGRLLGNHLVDRGSRCRVLGEPGVIPRADAAKNYRIPDIGVTCAPEEPGPAMPEPVLLIEILSPSNHSETRANFWAYTTIPSVNEILIVHSERIEAELLRRGPDGSWPDSPDVIRPPAALELASIGFSAPVATLYRTTALAEDQPSRVASRPPRRAGTGSRTGSTRR